MKRIVIILAVIVVLSGRKALAQGTVPILKFEPVSKTATPIISRSGVYDYQASVIREDNGNVKVWDCGQESATMGSDAIVYTEFDSQGSRIDGPKVVMTANHGDDKSFDNLHTCSPTVVKFKNPQMDPDGPSGPMPMGGEYYLMFYECAPLFYNKCDGSLESTNGGSMACDQNKRAGLFNEICSAASSDGIHWMKYSSDLWNQGYRHYGDQTTPPTPIVKVSPQLAANCGWDEADFKSTGKMRIYLQSSKCMDMSVNYGTGQEGTLVKKQDNGGLQLWLYYYDSMGDWNKRGTYLTKSWDGIHFDSPVRINSVTGTSIGVVKYYDGEVSGQRGIYISGEPIVNSNFFTYSFDGVNWVAAAYTDEWWNHGKDPLTAISQPEIQAFNIGKATDNMCPLPGKIGLLGDKYGYLDSLNSLVFYLGEGQVGGDASCVNTSGDQSSSRLDTWNIYKISGNLVPITTSGIQPKCTSCPAGYNRSGGDANCDGKIDLMDFMIWKDEYLQSNGAANSNYRADFDCNGIVDLNDFLKWKDGYLRK